jgi:hypothetical protein
MITSLFATQQPSARGTRIACVAGLCILSALLLWQTGSLVAYLKAVLSYPYQLDYGEGIVWQQMRNMVRGTAYGPLAIFPAIVYHYPPVYHMTAATLAATTGIDPLVSGRIVSILSSFATAVMVGLLTMRVTPVATGFTVKNVSAALAGLMFLTCYPVMMWTPLMRVDMLAGVFALAGILLSLRAIDRPYWIYGGAVMFVLSIYTKQISVAAPLATFSVFLLVCPRLAVRGILACLLVGGIALASLSLVTDNGFLTHILLYNLNRITPALLGGVLLEQIVARSMLIALAVLGAVASWREIRRITAGANTLALVRHTLVRDRAAVTALVMLLFLAIKTIMLLGMMKSGSSYNYMIEWLSAVTVFAGVSTGPLISFATGRHMFHANRLITGAIALVGLPLQLIFTSPVFPNAHITALNAQAYVPIVALIRASARPVISDDMTLLIRAGKDVEWESAITAELAHKGIYDQATFADLVRAHCFAFFLVEGNTDTQPFVSRYNLPVAAAILSAYPREETVGKFVLHLPPAGMAQATHCPMRNAAGALPE